MYLAVALVVALVAAVAAISGFLQATSNADKANRSAADADAQRSTAVVSSALADAQRGLNMITREVANSGYGLTDNGIVTGDSSPTSIRVRANLNASEAELTSGAASDKDEDVKFMLYTENSNSYIVRLDVNVSAQEMVLANKVDSLTIRYYPDKVFYTTGDCDIGSVVDSAGNPVSEVTQKSSTKYIVISICVTLPEVGSPGSDGYQPPSRVQLVSDAALRNSDLVNY